MRLPSKYAGLLLIVVIACGAEVFAPIERVAALARLGTAPDSVLVGDAVTVPAPIPATRWNNLSPALVAITAATDGVTVRGLAAGLASVQAVRDTTVRVPIGKSGKFRYRADSVWQTVTLRVVAPVVTAPPSDTTPADTIIAPQDSVAVTAGHDFEDGTFGPFTNPWESIGDTIRVVDDPTGSGRGKVARIHYRNDPSVGFYDHNLALMYKRPVKLGESIDFEGDVHLGGALPFDNTHQRKLIYWQAGSDFGTTRRSSVVIAAWGWELLVIAKHVTQGDGEHTAYQYVNAGFTNTRWHRLKVYVRINTAPAANDAVVRVWLDGRLIYETTSYRFTDPAWTGVDWSKFNLGTFLVGDQVNTVTGSTVQFDEVRYWDRLRFSVTP
jgi:hypothetical protein